MGVEAKTVVVVRCDACQELLNMTYDAEYSVFDTLDELEAACGEAGWSRGGGRYTCGECDFERKLIDASLSANRA